MYNKELIISLITRKEEIKEKMVNFNQKDPYMMLSLINTKLRDECESFDDLCSTYDLEVEEVISRMDAIGYSYDSRLNQFVQ